MTLSDTIRNWLLELVLSKLDAMEAEMSLTTDAITALDLKIDELILAIKNNTDQAPTLAAIATIGTKVQATIDSLNAPIP